MLVRLKRHFAKTLFLGAAAIVASPGHAQMDGCEIELQREIVPPAFVYDPFEPISPIEQKTLGLISPSAARAFVTIETEAGQPLPALIGTSGVAVTLNAQRTNGWSPATPGSFTVELAPDEMRMIDVDFLIDNSIVAPAGSYRERLFVRITNLDTGINCDDRQAFDIVLDVPPRAQLNIAGTRGDFDRSLGLPMIDFGALATGVTKTVFLQVRSNSDLELRISSDNGGTMVLESGDIDARVPYEAFLNSQAIDLSSQFITQAPAADTYEGRSLPLEFTVGSVSGVPSGEYTDTVIVEVSGL